LFDDKVSLLTRWKLSACIGVERAGWLVAQLGFSSPHHAKTASKVYSWYRHSALKYNRILCRAHEINKNKRMSSLCHRITVFPSSDILNVTRLTNWSIYHFKFNYYNQTSSEFVCVFNLRFGLLFVYPNRVSFSDTTHYTSVSLIFELRHTLVFNTIKCFTG